MPKDEVNKFTDTRLTQVSFEDSIDTLDSTSTRQFRIVYKREN